jgi:hypothetical protein
MIFSNAFVFVQLACCPVTVDVCSFIHMEAKCNTVQELMLSVNNVFRSAAAVKYAA